MMFKKIICFVLSLSLLLSFCSFANESENVNLYETQAISFLRSLEIIDEYIPSQYVTRGEFAKISYKLLGNTEELSEVKGNMPFYDVDKNDINAPYIKAVKDLNLISGYSDKSFRKDENISTSEALVVLIRMLGYGIRANAKGGYPAGFLAIEKELNLSKNLTYKYSDKITKGDLAILISNTLETDTLEITGVSNGSNIMENTGTTLLYKNFKINVTEGVVTSVDSTKLRGEAIDTPPHHITVESFLINNNNIDANKYLGYFVKAYYEETSGEPLLKFICKKHGKNSEEIIDIEKVTGISGNVISFYEDEKTEKLTFDKTSALIYNQVSTKKAFTYDLIKDKKGTIKLIDNNNDNKADVIFIESYITIVAGQTDITSYSVYDYFDKNKKTVLNTEKDDPYVLLYNGNDYCSFGKITPKTVITVYETLDDAPQKFIRAYISKSKAKGVLKSIEIIDDERVLYFDDENLVKISDECYEKSKNMLLIGSYIEVGTDVNGVGAYVEYNSSELRTAYLVTAKKEKRFDGDINVKIMDTDMNFEIYKMSDKVEIDGMKYKNLDDKIFKALNNGVKGTLYKNGEAPDSFNINPDCYAQLIRYTLDNKGRINYIDTVLNNSFNDNIVIGTKQNKDGKNSLYMENYGTLNYKIHARSFGGKILLSKEAVVLRVPAVNKPTVNYLDEELYDIKNYTFFPDNKNVNISAYFDGGDNIAPEFLTIANDGEGQWPGTSTPLSVFKERTEAVTEDGEVVSKITLIDKNKEVSYFMEDRVKFVIPDGNTTSGYITAKDLKCGDMIRFVEGKEGFITSFEVPYRAETDTFIKGLSYTKDVYDPLRLVKGYVYSTYSDGMKFKVTDNTADMESLKDMEIIRYGSFPVTIYDSTKKSNNMKVKSGSFSDLIGYEKSGSDCSKIIIQQRYCEPISVYIIK